MFFETIKIQNKQIQNIKYHNARFQKTIKNYYGIDTHILLEEYIDVSELSSDIHKCKIIYTNKIIKVEYSAYHIKQIKKIKLIYNNTQEYKYKFTNRKHIDIIPEGFDEIIFVKNGLITDSSVANVAILVGNDWITPLSPLLKGTMRQKLLDTHQIIVENITVDMITNASKIAFLNAMVGFRILDKYDLYS